MIRQDLWNSSSWNAGKVKVDGMWVGKSKLPTKVCPICEIEFKHKSRVYCSKYCAGIMGSRKAALVTKGKPTWNTNLTVETDERLRNSHTKRMKTINDRGYLLTEEQSRRKSEKAKGRKAWNDGLTKEMDERVMKISESNKGNVSWCKDLTKETDERVMKISLKLKGKSTWAKGETKETHPGIKAHSDSIKGRTKENHDGVAITSKKNKKHWSDPIFKEEMLRKQREGAQIKPNKSERILDSILQKYFPNEWKFVGDGYTWIGGKNPDFLNINGKKQLIEHLGCYWHHCPIHFSNLIKGDEEEDRQDRIDHFKKYGFDTLVVWEHELKDEEQVVERVRSFI